MLDGMPTLVVCHNNDNVSLQTVTNSLAHTAAIIENCQFTAQKSFFSSLAKVRTLDLSTTWDWLSNTAPMRRHNNIADKIYFCYCLY